MQNLVHVRLRTTCRCNQTECGQRLEGLLPNAFAPATDGPVETFSNQMAALRKAWHDDGLVDLARVSTTPVNPQQLSPDHGHLLAPGQQSRRGSTGHAADLSPLRDFMKHHVWPHLRDGDSLADAARHAELIYEHPQQRPAAAHMGQNTRIVCQLLGIQFP